MIGSTPRVGVIVHRGRDALFNAFLESLAGLGYVDGENIEIEPRFAEGVLERTHGFAADLVARNVDLIAAIGGVGARAAQRATDKIPILYAVVLDPVEMGFAVSHERPGLNLTGVTNYDPDLATKQLSLLKAVVPHLERIAVLSDADVPGAGTTNTLERSNAMAAARLGIELQWVRIKGPAPDRPAAFKLMKDGQADALQVLEMPVVIADFQSIAGLAIEHKLPSMFPGGWNHDGLMAYGTSLLQTIPDLASLVDLVLKGADPAGIPVRHVCEHRLRLNLATARKIGLDIAPAIVASASEVVRFGE